MPWVWRVARLCVHRAHKITSFGPWHRWPEWLCGVLSVPSAVALGMAVERLSCFFTELPDTPAGTSFGIRLDPEDAARHGPPADVPLRPSLLYEIVLRAAAFTIIWFRLRHRLVSAGENLTFSLLGCGMLEHTEPFVIHGGIRWSRDDVADPGRLVRPRRNRLGRGVGAPTHDACPARR